MTNDPKSRDPGAEKLGWAMLTLEAGIEGYRSWSVDIEGFSIRTPLAQHGEYLLVLKGIDGEGGPVVAFHSATSLSDLFCGAANRLGNGTFKWRVDEFRT